MRTHIHARARARAISCDTAVQSAAPPPTAPCVRAKLRHPSAAYFWVFLIVMLLRPNPSAHQVVPDCVGQGKVVIAFGGHISVFHKGEVKMPVEVSFQVRNVFHPGKPTDRYLLPLLLVCQRLGHVYWRVLLGFY